MASLTYSNVVNPLTTALSNKINPSPLPKVNGISGNQSTTPALQGGGSYMQTNKNVFNSFLPNQNLANAIKNDPGFSPSNPYQEYAVGKFPTTATGGLSGAKTIQSGNNYAGSAFTPTTQQATNNQSIASNGFQGITGSTPPTTTPQTTSATSTTTPTNGNPYPGYVQQLANQGNSGYNQATQQAITNNNNIATNTKDPNNPGASTNYNNAQIAQGNLQGFANNQTPAVVNAEKDYNQFAQSSPYMLAAQSNPNVAADVASGRTSLLGQTFAAELGAKQQAVSNALTGQGQQISAAGTGGDQALTGVGQQIDAAQNAGNLAQTGQANQQSALDAAAGRAAPITQFGVATSPITGQPIGGGTPQSAAFSGGQTQSSLGLGGTYQNNSAAIQSAQGLTQQFNALLNVTPNFNANDVNAVNALAQSYQNNTSNPNNPQLQSQFNAILNQYAQVLGKDTVNNIISTSKGSTMSALLQSLSDQANKVNEGVKNAGTGQSSTNTSSSGGEQYSW